MTGVKLVGDYRSPGDRYAKVMNQCLALLLLVSGGVCFVQCNKTYQDVIIGRQVS